VVLLVLRVLLDHPYYLDDSGRIEVSANDAHPEASTGFDPQRSTMFLV